MSSRNAVRGWLRTAVVLATLSLAGCSAAPEPVATPDPLSAEQKSALIASQVSSELEQLMASYPDAVVPEVEMVRMITLDEWATVIAKCLTDQGFPTDVTDDGGMTRSVPDGQEEAAAIARFVCDVQYPVDPLYNQPLNESQLIFLYDYYTNDLRECLESHGYEIGEPPSKQVFVDTYGDGVSWSPYSSVDGGDWDDLNRDCPQVPVGIYG